MKYINSICLIVGVAMLIGFAHKNTPLAILGAFLLVFGVISSAVYAIRTEWKKDLERARKEGPFQKPLPPDCVNQDFAVASHEMLINLLKSESVGSQNFKEELIKIIEKDGITWNQRRLVGDAAHKVATDYADLLKKGLQENPDTNTPVPGH
jgi:hypothetical protein